jgi:hypothetical protein
MTSPFQTFARESERDAYRVLHEGGRDALEDAYGTAIASDLINRWCDHRIVTLKWVDGCCVIRTFKKYAQ